MGNDTILMATMTFTISALLCVVPKILTKIKHVKTAFPYMTVFSAGLMLSVILQDFIPHLTSDGCHSSNTKICPVHKKTISKCPDDCSAKQKSLDDHHHDHKHHDHSSGAHSHFNYGFLIAGVTFIFLLGIDSIVLKHSHCDNRDLIENHHLHDHDKFGSCNTESLKYSTSKLQAFVFLISLSVHSFFEGLVFNGSGSMKTYEIGVLIHKALESFALGVTIFSTKFSKVTIFLLIFVYSLLTPLGIVLANGISLNHITENIFNGLALGSTLFIIFVEMIPPNFHSSDDNIAKVAVLFAGYSLTSLVIFLMHLNNSV
ncbi:putative ZIP zinc transporter [Hamiltosporidium tvaerminnensis]|uniref:Putative ZIP zinc transporter n=1 Tax=Hamiltosporidium tvaerminnensis TaxID=1176355 RepID=A0A4Q9L7G8_9MICR|nr:putative ZIP zinc transporter [Hamiltosporidium tvaerminnensis]